MSRRQYYGLRTMVARPGSVFFCPGCMRHQPDITVHLYVDLDSNQDVSYDHWDDACRQCDFVGVMMERSITWLIRLQMWWAQRRANHEKRI